MRIPHATSRRFAVVGSIALAAVLSTAAIVSPSLARSRAATPVTHATTAASQRIESSRIVVVDHTRPTVSHGHVLSRDRRLPTLILRPVKDARYPLVVFCHGFDSSPVPYLHLLRHWAAAGFVVAAPYFPLTRPKAGRWLDESDVDNQPGDVSAVITAVLQRLPLSVDPSHIVVAGHSDGGSTAFGVGFADRLRDPRVSAVMVFSGDKRPTMGRFSRRRLPMLQIQSNHDESNSLRSARKVWRIARRPKVYVHLLGARHLPPFSSPCRWRPIVEAVTTDFLRAWTTKDPKVEQAERAALGRAGDDKGLSWVTDDE